MKRKQGLVRQLREPQNNKNRLSGAKKWALAPVYACLEDHANAAQLLPAASPPLSQLRRMQQAPAATQHGCLADLLTQSQHRLSAFVYTFCSPLSLIASRVAALARSRVLSPPLRFPSSCLCFLSRAAISPPLPLLVPVACASYASCRCGCAAAFPAELVSVAPHAAGPCSNTAWLRCGSPHANAAQLLPAASSARTCLVVHTKP